MDLIIENNYKVWEACYGVKDETINLLFSTREKAVDYMVSQFRRVMMDDKNFKQVSKNRYRFMATTEFCFGQQVVQDGECPEPEFVKECLDYSGDENDSDDE